MPFLQHFLDTSAGSKSMDLFIFKDKYGKEFGVQILTHVMLNKLRYHAHF